MRQNRLQVRLIEPMPLRNYSASALIAAPMLSILVSDHPRGQSRGIWATDNGAEPNFSTGWKMTALTNNNTGIRARLVFWGGWHERSTRLARQ